MGKSKNSKNNANYSKTPYDLNSYNSSLAASSKNSKSTNSFFVTIEKPIPVTYPKMVNSLDK